MFGFYDTLESIERQYGCVAEYNRSRFDDEEHEYALKCEREESYKRDEALYKKAVEEGTLIPYGWHSECTNCEYGTCLCRSWDDDCGHIVCGNENRSECATWISSRTESSN